jgi:hypothetical protein
MRVEMRVETAPLLSVVIVLEVTVEEAAELVEAEAADEADGVDDELLLDPEDELCAVNDVDDGEELLDD